MWPPITQVSRIIMKRLPLRGVWMKLPQPGDRSQRQHWKSSDQKRIRWRAGIDRTQERISELIESGDMNIARLTVAAGMMNDIAKTRN